MSEKSIADKLLIKAGYRVLVLNAPPAYQATLGPLPAGVELLSAPSGGPFDQVQVFVTSSAELEKRLPGMKALLKPKGLLWVVYPKGKSGFNRDTIWAYATTVGWQAVALVSVDDTWSAMRLKPV